MDIACERKGISKFLSRNWREFYATFGFYSGLFLSILCPLLPLPQTGVVSLLHGKGMERKMSWVATSVPNSRQRTQATSRVSAPTSQDMVSSSRLCQSREPIILQWNTTTWFKEQIGDRSSTWQFCSLRWTLINMNELLSLMTFPMWHKPLQNCCPDLFP